ncbi:MAG: hypothetical protein H7144_08120 [Burkholderiales bacterium]|nr:hypothetical protein [Phycisphaerae bacterium]
MPLEFADTEDGDKHDKNQFGLSWQVVPSMMDEWFKDHTSDGTWRAMNAMMTMKKLDIGMIRQAYEG